MLRGQMLFALQIPRLCFEREVISRPSRLDSLRKEAAGLTIGKHGMDAPELYQQLRLKIRRSLASRFAQPVLAETFLSGPHRCRQVPHLQIKTREIDRN